MWFGLFALAFAMVTGLAMIALLMQPAIVPGGKAD
jgi:hypothetical protein